MLHVVEVCYVMVLVHYTTVVIALYRALANCKKVEIGRMIHVVVHVKILVSSATDEGHMTVAIPYEIFVTDHMTVVTDHKTVVTDHT